MNKDRNPQALGLPELALECTNQEILYRKLGEKASDPRFCYELFRRAIVQRDDDAWSLVYQQYEAQVVRWIRQHSAFRSTHRPPDYFVSEVFSRFWRAVSPQKFTQELGTLVNVLSYLKKCVNSALYDHLRVLKRESMCSAVELVVSKPPNPASRNSVENYLVQKLNAEQFWKLIESTLKNEREAAATENYTMDKKARQIRIEYPHLFADINSVYRTKENLMKRWRRDPNLKAWYTDGGK